MDESECYVESVAVSYFWASYRNMIKSIGYVMVFDVGDFLKNMFISWDNRYL